MEKDIRRGFYHKLLKFFGMNDAVLTMVFFLSVISYL